MASSRNHFIQINDASTVTVKATLMVQEPVLEVGTVTGPGIFNVQLSPDQFELISATDTVVLLSGH